MFNKKEKSRIAISAALAAFVWLAPVLAAAQDLVAISSITGGSSVFVFRGSTRQAKRFVSGVKPSRSKAQRMESSGKIRRQIDAIAKQAPKREKAKVVDPTKIPSGAERTMPAAQVSKLFAGVGEYYLAKGDFTQSFDFFRDAIRLDDKNLTAKTGFSDALAVQGNELLVKEKPAEAKAVFLEALKYDPKNSAAYFGLGEVYVELGENTDAIANYERALQSDKDITEIYVPLGIIYYQAGDVAKADDLLTKALATSSGSAETQFFLGLARASQSRNDEAVAAFQKAKTLDPTYAEAFFNSAEILVKLKRPAEAIPDYQKAIELKPNYFDASLGLAEAEYETGNFAAAIVDFTIATRLKNDNWQAFAGLGDAYLKTGKFNDAAAKLSLAALFLTNGKSFDKTTAADLYSKVGYAYGQQCEIDALAFKPCPWGVVVKNLDKAIEMTGDPLDYANLGWAYLNASRVDMRDKKIPDQQAKLGLAKTALEKAAASSNTVVADSARQNLGAVLNDMGDFNGAIASLKDVFANHPDWDFSGYALGTAYYKVNDFDNASKTLRGVVDKGPSTYYLPALKNLGATEIKRKKGKDVKWVIKQLRKVSPIDAQLLERDMKMAKL